MEKIDIARTRKGFPAYWVGGGCATNTFGGVFVLTSRGKLPSAIFHRTSGPLAGAYDQSLVPLGVGDQIIRVHGRRPVTFDNPDITWDVKVVAAIRGTVAEVESVSGFNLEFVPAKVLEGLCNYHNRDGRYFVAEEEAGNV